MADENALKEEVLTIIRSKCEQELETWMIPYEISDGDCALAFEKFICAKLGADTADVWSKLRQARREKDVDERRTLAREVIADMKPFNYSHENLRENATQEELEIVYHDFNDSRLYATRSEFNNFINEFKRKKSTCSLA